MKRGGDEERNGADEQTGKMNADEDWRWWDKRETGGRGKKNCDGRLKYLWCHLCWRMTPPLCNNMNEDSTGCLESPNFTRTIYSYTCFCFFGVFRLWVRRKMETAFTAQEEAEAQCHKWVLLFDLQMKSKCTTNLWLQALVNILLLCAAFYHITHYSFPDLR